MKILFVGGLVEGQTSRMRMLELRQLGHTVHTVDAFDRWNQADPFTRRYQQWRCSGSIVDELNKEVADAANEFRPDLLWAEKQEFLRAETLAEVKKRGAKLLHYTPDPYFTLTWKRTRLMDEALRCFDYLVTAKAYELGEYSRLPAKTIYSPLAFSEQAHRPKTPANEVDFRLYDSDVSFLGGWEPRRERLLAKIADTGEVGLKIWGYGWDHLADGKWTPRRAFAMRRNAGGDRYSITRNSKLAAAVQGNEVYGDAYAWAISAAKISLGLLRRVCPDQHTTRSFEIPACGSMMLADRTREHEELFVEGREAEFFSSDGEMLEKIAYYLDHEPERRAVAKGGYDRCFSGGYSYRERVIQILDEIQA